MKSFIFLLPVVLPLFLNAQNITISEGLSIRNDVAYHLVGDLKGNLLLFRDEATDFEVQAFSRSLHLSWKKKIALDKKRPEVIDVTETQQNFSVIYQFNRKRDLLLKVHKYNPAANLIDSVTIKNYGSVYNTPYFEVAYSANKEVVVVYYVLGNNEIHTLAFNLGTMKLMWEKILAPNDIIFDRDFHQIVVDNGGNMHLVFQMENRKSKQKEHFFEFFDYGPATANNVHRYIIPMQGHLTYDAYFSFDHLNKRLLAGGLYSDTSIDRAEGFFYLNIPPQNPENHLLTFQKFEDSFVKTLEEKEKNKNKGIAEANIQDLVLRRDGGILMIGELNHRFERRTTGIGSGGYYGSSGSPSTVDYYFDDIFLIAVHPNGQMHWKMILHKKQYSQDDDAMYSSYFLLKTPSALRFLFNDDIKYNNTVSEYVVTGNGKYDLNALMNTENQKLRLRFRDAVQTASNEVLVPSERRSKLKLVRITY